MEEQTLSLGHTEARPPQESIERALFEIKRVIAGQDAMLERVLVCLLAGGHLLLEGVPGLAKTLTVKTTAQVLGGTFSRSSSRPTSCRATSSAHASTGRTAATSTSSWGR
jgi:MoxR-like ATPase